ncbi:hypothetical protein [Chromobacterium haemolyticum]|uniref:hypothetical protein n=1 Tax=Chromobacterium haemolyticum TaxID=394935 RepID=UPI0024473103|nr:hypothetical protein [Chromobacterium haemolyticum]MDH0339892.1 hypothetical protein [Chromobacterium haemolyticum]
MATPDQRIVSPAMEFDNWLYIWMICLLNLKIGAKKGEAQALRLSQTQAAADRERVLRTCSKSLSSSVV